jgi:uncharacterized membrane protein YidH (DUF202 family)
LSEALDEHEPAPERDPGLAAERTTIAWARSGLALVTVTVAVMRGLPDLSRGAAVAFVALVLAGGLGAAVVMGYQRHVAHDLAPILYRRLRLLQLAWSVTLVGLVCLGIVALAGP